MLDRLITQSQGCCDFFIRLAFSDQRQHPLLLRRQTFRLGLAGFFDLRLHAGEDSLRDGWIEDGMSRRNGPDRL